MDQDRQTSGGSHETASVDPKGVLLGWVGLGLSLMISILGAATIRTSSQGPVFLLLLLALMGTVISETLVSLCMAAPLHRLSVAVPRPACNLHPEVCSYPVQKTVDTLSL